MIYYFAIYDILLFKTTVFTSRNDASIAMNAMPCNHNTTRIACKENRPTLASGAVSVL